MLKPAPLFLFRSWDAAEPTDRNLFRKANTRMTWSAVPRRVVLRRVLGWIYRFPFVLARQFGTNARKTRADLGRSYPGQLRDLLMLAATANIGPRDYYQFGLARFRGGDDLRDFISHDLYYAPAYALALRRVAASGISRDFFSKIEFERRFRELGFDCARTVAIVTPDDVLGLDGRPAMIEPPEADLFVKPDRAGQGLGTALFRNTAPGRYRGADGVEMDAARLFGRIRETAAASDWYSDYGPPSARPAAIRERMLVQVALRNAPGVAAKVGQALATARIITLRDEDDNPEIVFAALRTAGASGAIVDNFHASGIAFPVDFRTGTLHAGRIFDFSADPRFHADHPVTGARIKGWQLPQWDRAAKLALDLHRGFPDLLHAGWDIAFTPSGPCVLEVNLPPGLPIVQMERGFLGTRYSRLMAHHIEKWLDGPAA